MDSLLNQGYRVITSDQNSWRAGCERIENSDFVVMNGVRNGLNVTYAEELNKVIENFLHSH
ncbi:hypothetical protein AB4Y90_16800 [Chryseobacterium sp. 2TAF14]|uniref:hypothetical protein n=1 Tax=Chryseobacterium sp. 2TAF14 TaxID=3233007 RepID=UPI003F91A48B